jgi:hypothetical protein
MTLMDDDH